MRAAVPIWNWTVLQVKVLLDEFLLSIFFPASGVVRCETARFIRRHGTWPPKFANPVRKPSTSVATRNSEASDLQKSMAKGTKGVDLNFNAVFLCSAPHTLESLEAFLDQLWISELLTERAES